MKAWQLYAPQWWKTEADKAQNFNEIFFIIIIIYKSNKAQCKTEKGEIVFTARKIQLKN